MSDNSSLTLADIQKAIEELSHIRPKNRGYIYMTEGEFSNLYKAVIILEKRVVEQESILEKAIEALVLCLSCPAVDFGWTRPGECICNSQEISARDCWKEYLRDKSTMQNKTTTDGGTK